MTPVDYSKQLLLQARVLAEDEADDDRRQANLRRSVSATYYAVFHFLVGEACRFLIGGGGEAAEASVPLGRTFSHTDLRKASELFQKARMDYAGGAMIPKGKDMPEGLGEMITVFIELQRRRETADYDLSESFEKADVRNSVEGAVAAIGGWGAIRDHQATRLFLLFCFDMARMKKERKAETNP